MNKQDRSPHTKVLITYTTTEMYEVSDKIDFKNIEEVKSYINANGLGPIKTEVHDAKVKVVDV